MAAGDVIFCRGVDEVSDIWDDTALIEAYDEAVSSMKTQIALQLGDNPGDTESPTVNSAPGHRKKHKKGRKQKKKAKLVSQRTASHTPNHDVFSPSGSLRHSRTPSLASHSGAWCVGQRCRAVYSEDGQVYEAVVIAIHSDGKSCTVRYTGYGNEEDQAMEDLLVSRETAVMSDDQGSITDSRDPPPEPSTAGARHKSDKNHQHFVIQPPPFPSLDGYTGAPFPPPPIPSHSEGVEQEALHNMLISWYMSGYHTGFYQGLKAGTHKNSAKPPPTDTS